MGITIYKVVLKVACEIVRWFYFNNAIIFDENFVDLDTKYYFRGLT